MQTYWTSKDIPELSQLPPLERRRILRHCAPMTFRHWETWAALFGCAVCAATGWYLGWIFGSGGWAAPWVGAGLGAAIGGAILGQVKGSMVRPYVRAELQLRPVYVTECSSRHNEQQE
jgi:hypothetical protein